MEAAAESPSGVRGPARSDVRGAIGIALVLAAGEVVLLALALLLHMPPLLWLAAHVILTGACAFRAWSARAARLDIGPVALALLACLVAGPAGALFAAAANWRQQSAPDHPELLEAWYARIALAGEIDEVTRLYDTVAMGRAVQTSTAVPQMFVSVMTGGTLEDRQAALGLIARRFEPSYAPALRAALVSSEPVIRVQAAAVAVKVRAELKASVTKQIAAAGALESDPRRAMEAAAALKAMAGSGLLEDTDRLKAEAAVMQLVGWSAAALEGAGETGAAGLDAAALSAVETELLRHGHYGAFRALRREAAAVPPLDGEPPRG